MNHRDYRLYELTHQKFETLCSKICIRVLGEGFINFAQGKDEGKDGKFEGKANALPSENEPYRGKFIIQAKHTTNPCRSCSDTQFKGIITKEVPKIENLNKNGELDYYFLLTNRKLTGKQEAKIQEQFKTSVPQISAVIIWARSVYILFLMIIRTYTKNLVLINLDHH